MVPVRPALDDPRTQAALRRYKRRCVRLTGFGFLVFALALGIIGSSEEDPKGILEPIALISFTWGGMAFLAGCWTQPALVLEAEPGAPEAVCSVLTFNWRYNVLRQGSNEPIVVAGDPLRWAIAARPEIKDLVVINQPLLGWWRRKLRKWAMADQADATS